MLDVFVRPQMIRLTLERRNGYAFRVLIVLDALLLCLSS